MKHLILRSARVFNWDTINPIAINFRSYVFILFPALLAVWVTHASGLKGFFEFARDLKAEW